MYILREFNWNRYTYKINSNFFKVWTPNMAYILGFTAADGNVYKTTLSWDLSNKYKSNLKLLKEFNSVMHSNYPIKRRKKSYKLKISNSEIIKDIKKLNIIPNKKRILKMPSVPHVYIKDFLRGFLDGDGWISIRTRKKGQEEVCVGFSNGSLEFMRSITKILEERCLVTRHNLRKREKTTPKGVYTITYQLEYYSEQAHNILTFLFSNIDKKQEISLGHKYEKYLKARQIYLLKEKIKKEGKTFVEKEKTMNIDMKEYLQNNLIIKQKLPIQIAKDLNVSLSTVYRWLEKTGVRKPVSRKNAKQDK